MKADSFLRYVLLRSTSGGPNIAVRCIIRTSSSDSDAVTGLEIWRQMAVTYAGSTQTQVIALFKQIMTPTLVPQNGIQKSAKVLPAYHHWLELISKRESLNSKKLASNIKITLALQNIRGPFARALSLSISENSTGMTFTSFSSITSTTASPQTQRGSISSASAARSPRRIQ